MQLSYTKKVLLIALTVLCVQGCESKNIQNEQPVMTQHQEDAVDRAKNLPPELQKALDSQ